MTISELQIQLDINKGNERALLEEHACLTKHGYFFVDSEDGQCWLFDLNGKLDDLKKMKTLDTVKRDIKKIVIPKGVKSIGNWAFYRCNSLTSIEIPNSIESIGYKAFQFCTSLKSIEISNSVTYIGSLTFYNCTSLKSTVFKGKTIDQVKAMGNYPWGIKDETIIKCS